MIGNTALIYQPVRNKLLCRASCRRCCDTWQGFTTHHTPQRRSYLLRVQHNVPSQHLRAFSIHTVQSVCALWVCWQCTLRQRWNTEPPAEEDQVFVGLQCFSMWQQWSRSHFNVRATHRHKCTCYSKGQRPTRTLERKKKKTSFSVGQ